MDKFKEIIFNQLVPTNSKTLNNIKAICNYDYNKKQRLLLHSICSTAIDVFNYGVIEGKRQERKKRLYGHDKKNK